MKQNPIITSRSAGYTLVEICVALAVFSVVGVIAYAILMSSTTLMAKNVSLNSSNVIVRAALDRMYSELNQGNKLPTLINTEGKVITTGSAAGIIFDHYIGGPYIVGNPGTGLPANTTSFKLFYSTDPLANPPTPQKNDVVIMDGSTRALVASCTTSTTLTAPYPSPTPNPGKMATVTLQGPLGSYAVPPVSSGTAIIWNSLSQQAAYIVHRKAFLVVPINGTTGPAELRMYPDAEKLTDYNDPTKYIVLTRSIGTNTVGGKTENTPFSIVTQNPNGTPYGNPFLNIAMRVEDQQYNKRLATEQANELNTFLRVDTMLRPRNIP